MKAVYTVSQIVALVEEDASKRGLTPIGTGSIRYRFDHGTGRVLFDGVELEVDGLEPQGDSTESSPALSS